MAKIEVIHPGYTVELETGSALPLTDPLVSELYEQIKYVRESLNTVGVQRISVLKRDTPPDTWDYKIVLADGREWKQTVTFSPEQPTDPLMTFDVATGWRLSEFMSQRGLRDAIIALLPHGLIKIEAMVS